MNNSEYFYIVPSLTQDVCDEIIALFENTDTGKYNGLTHGGYQSDVKETVDYVIPENELWKNIYTLINNEIYKNVEIYINNYNNKYINCNINNKSERKFDIFGNTFDISKPMIQRYLQNKGRYIYHDDFSINYEKKHIEY